MEEAPDEEMGDVGALDERNLIPSSFLPGPGLSREEAYNRMVAGAGENLVNLGIAIPDQQAQAFGDMASWNGEQQRRAQVNRQKTPEEARVAERYDLAEAVAQLPVGYFYPGMPEARQKQLAAIIAAGTPQIINHNTPGMAGTSTASNLC
jgi:hypothetical protein